MHNGILSPDGINISTGVGEVIFPSNVCPLIWTDWFDFQHDVEEMDELWRKVFVSALVRSSGGDMKHFKGTRSEKWNHHLSLTHTSMSPEAVDLGHIFSPR